MQLVLLSCLKVPIVMVIISLNRDGWMLCFWLRGVVAPLGVLFLVGTSSFLFVLL